MRDSERYRLRYGRYKTPRFRYGRKVEDAAGNEYTIVGLHDARVPWPVGKRGSVRSIVLYGDLVKAVRREPAIAVMHWWGVGASTVQKWRRILGVGHENAGTVELRRRHFDEPWGHKARKLARAKARDPARRAKIAAAKRGVKRPASVVEAMRKRMLGAKLPAETRRKMSEAHNRRGTRPPKAGRPWSKSEDALLRRLAAADVAERTGRTLKAVYFRRHQLGVTGQRGKPPQG